MGCPYNPQCREKRRKKMLSEIIGKILHPHTVQRFIRVISDPDCYYKDYRMIAEIFRVQDTPFNEIDEVIYQESRRILPDYVKEAIVCYARGSLKLGYQIHNVEDWAQLPIKK